MRVAYVIYVKRSRKTERPLILCGVYVCGVALRIYYLTTLYIYLYIYAYIYCYNVACLFPFPCVVLYEYGESVAGDLS